MVGMVGMMERMEGFVFNKNGWRWMEYDVPIKIFVMRLGNWSSTGCGRGGCNGMQFAIRCNELEPEPGG